MNERTIQHNRLLIPAFALLLCMTLGLLLTAGVFAEPSSATDASELVAGSYDGSVTVSEPAPLGELHLRLDVTSANGRLAGAVNPLKTQVFLGGPTFTGQVTVTHGVTTTVRIESELFSSMISGRAIQRRFILTGAVLENGNTLRGNYTEMILGFNPQPLLVKGTFLLTRPGGLQSIVTVPPPAGSTPTPTSTRPGSGGGPTATPTATPTKPPVDGMTNRIYLPLINR